MTTLQSHYIAIIDASQTNWHWMVLKMVFICGAARRNGCHDRFLVMVVKMLSTAASIWFAESFIGQVIVSGFERACHLFRTRRYKVISPSDYAVRIRTPNVQCCLFWRKNRNENKIKLCFWWISNVSERLFRNGIVSSWNLRWDIFKLYLVRNCVLSL